jgi:hypothetical protein
MKNMRVFLIILFLNLGLITSAQQIISTSGGNASSSGGSVSFSIGQIAYTTVSGIAGSASQGVQQAFEIFSVGSNETALNISLIAFPNPTADNLTLQISNYNHEKLSYQLFDLKGKQLSKGNITTHLTQIDLSNFPSATYLVNVVSNENKQIQSYKIIKQ